jgi:hypothetical protein
MTQPRARGGPARSTAPGHRSDRADRYHACRGQTLSIQAGELRRALARRSPTQQNTPFCAPSTDRTEGIVPVQNGGTARDLSDRLHHSAWPLSRRSRSDWLEGVVDRVRVDAVSEGGGRGSKISPGRHLLHGDCENLKPGVQGAERSTSMWHRGPVARASLPSPVSRLTSNASASATYEAS